MKNHKVEKGCILAALLFVLLWIGGSFPVNAKETGRGRVLFISSYSYAWETIPQQIDGIRKSLGDDVTIDYKFMDTKNVDTAENVHLFYKSLSYYLSQVPAYDVVIVGDDAAYNFVLVYRKIFGNTPIVFEGVNNVSKALAMDYNPNVTGIIENQTYGNTIGLAKKIYPEAAHIVAIVDNTVTGLSARKEFYSYKDEFPDLEFSDINASEFSQKDLIKSVESFDESTILLYILCSNDKDGNVYASAESVQMLSSRAHIPMFSGISIGMGKGLLGGEIVSHEEMGEIAGEMRVTELKRRHTGSTIRWLPDLEVFTDIDIPLDYYQDVMKRQAVVNAGVTFRLRSEVSPGRFETQDFLYENGIRDYLAELAGDDPITRPVCWEAERQGRDRADKPEYKVKLNIAWCFSNRVHLMEHYHNSSFLEHGGSPDKATRLAFVAALDKYLRENNKYTKGESKITFPDVQECLLLVSSNFSTQTSYENQTKKAITNKFIQDAMSEFLRQQLQVYFIENHDDAERMAAQVLINKRSRETAERTRLGAKKKLSEKIDIANRVQKFVDCRT